jgi:hypothetical protein
MGIAITTPSPPEKQEPLDLGELSKYRAGEYIKVDGRWYFISQLNFVSSAGLFRSPTGAKGIPVPEEIELTLVWVPGKKDDE